LRRSEKNEEEMVKIANEAMFTNYNKISRLFERNIVVQNQIYLLEELIN